MIINRDEAVDTDGLRVGLAQDFDLHVSVNDEERNTAEVI